MEPQGRRFESCLPDSGLDVAQLVEREAETPFPTVPQL